MTFDERLLTCEEAATLLAIKPRTVRELIRRGELTSVKVGGSVRVRRVDLNKYLQPVEVAQ